MASEVYLPASASVSTASHMAYPEADIPHIFHVPDKVISLILQQFFSLPFFSRKCYIS